MKRKLFYIFISLCSLSLFISCFSYKYFQDIQFEKLEISNAKFEDDYYTSYNLDRIEYNKFSIIAYCELKDTMTKVEKLTNSLRDLNLIQNVNAIDPGKLFIFSLNDSIKNLRIYSLNDFNDTLRKESDLNRYFDLSYCDVFSNHNDSLKADLKLSDIKELNRILSAENTYPPRFISLLLKLNEKPKFPTQQFVLNINFYSGRQLNDTTNLIELE